MEPITLASAFATIVSLFATYKSERRAAEQDKFSDFTKWLSERGFDDMRSFIENNSRAQNCIETLLKERTEIILTKIERIDSVLAYLASGIDTFRDLVEVLKPQSKLSHQAIDILRQMEQAKASELTQVYIDVKGPVFLIEGGGDLKYEEPRFIEDDLSILVELSMLRLKHTRQGTRKLLFTRAASQYLNAIDSKSKSD